MAAIGCRRRGAHGECVPAMLEGPRWRHFQGAISLDTLAKRSSQENSETARHLHAFTRWGGDDRDLNRQTLAGHTAVTIPRASPHPRSAARHVAPDLARLPSAQPSRHQSRRGHPRGAIRRRDHRRQRAPAVARPERGRARRTVDLPVRSRRPDPPPPAHAAELHRARCRDHRRGRSRQGPRHPSRATARRIRPPRAGLYASLRPGRPATRLAAQLRADPGARPPAAGPRDCCRACRGIHRRRSGPPSSPW